MNATTMETKANSALSDVPENWQAGLLRKLPDLLRNGGAIAVLFALYSFFLKGWAGGNDLLHYYMLLANTVLLTVFAFAVGHYCKEGKSPRLLLSLALISVPVNFAILGAFIFYASSYFGGHFYPSYFAWSIGSLEIALATVALALALLIPIVLLAYRTLARGMSKGMSALFILSNIVLLIPVREPILVSLVALALASLTLFITARTARQKIEAKTIEGKFALLIQFLPLAIMVGRNIWLYADETLVLWASSAIAFIALKHLASLTSANSISRITLNVLSLLAAFGTGVLSAEFLLDINCPESLILITAVLISSGLCYEVSRREDPYSKIYGSIAIITLVTGLIWNLVTFGGAIASLGCLPIGTGLVASSYVSQQRSLFLGGTILGLVGLVDQAIHVFAYFDFNYWIALSIAGVAAIILASLLESRGDAMKRFLSQSRNQFQQWDF